MFQNLQANCNSRCYNRKLEIWAFKKKIFQRIGNWFQKFKKICWIFSSKNKKKKCSNFKELCSRTEDNNEVGDKDPFKEIQSAKLYLAISLHRVSREVPGVFGALIQGLTPPMPQLIMQYFKLSPELQEPYVI